ncbi:MAG: hypothetical protein GVY19_12525 [Bacteroidetes bacterium]|jgi:hypothetical protein|nr:hypothetical protein [Bacteroidota bacterium]
MKLPQLKIIGLLIVFAITTPPIIAQDFDRHAMESTTENAPKGLKVGSQAPDFTSVNQHGAVIYTHFDYNYRERAPVHEIVEALK